MVKVLTQHVQSANSVGLERFDGIVHVVRRRGWRCQVIDLVHCKKQAEHRSVQISYFLYFGFKMIQLFLNFKAFIESQY